MKKTKHSFLRVFFLAFFMFSLIIIPDLVYNKGYLVFYGDFNSQQLPFIRHMHDCVSSGNILWDWGTDLGSDFINSYSFYLLGSPFFWLTTLIPEEFVLYSVPWILSLKYAFAALTSYAYIRRFTFRDSSAVIGSLLYAFSGFQAYNIFFNHFHDVTALFPLMLIAMEEHVTKNRRGFFALTVTLMALTNYFFFAGQAVFLVIYFILRSRCSDFRVRPAKFFTLAAEALIGTAMASVLLVPAALSVLGNYRVSKHLYGMDMLAYSDRTRVWRVIQSFFMIPDSPARPNLFSEGTSKWSSIAGYLPLFSMAAVLSFLRYKPDSWKSRLIKICIVCAFVPVLNSAFYMFNAEYYARWFYMPVLIMALVTAQVFERSDIKTKAGFRICTLMLLAFLIISLLPSKEKDEVKWMAFGSHRIYLYMSLGLTGLFLAGAGYVFFLKSIRRSYIKKGVIFTALAAFITTAAVFYYGIYDGPYPDRYIAASINDTSSSVTENEEGFFRTDISESADNYPMFWGLSSMRCFQSTVSPSVIDFYNTVGIKRDVASRADTTYYALRGLLSVKYYFNQYEYGTKKEQNPLSMPGFKKISSGENFAVYENTEFVPVGFAYSSYMTEDDFGKIYGTSKANALIHSVLLSDEQAERLGGILERCHIKSVTLSQSTYLEDCRRHRENSCAEFKRSTRGFEASFETGKETLLFFSVPYDKGFTAYVNGRKAEIEKVNGGFMAVAVPAGKNEIVFDYFTYGLREGIMISAASAGIYIIYCIVFFFIHLASRIKSRKYRNYTPEITPDAESVCVYSEGSEIDIPLQEEK